MMTEWIYQAKKSSDYLKTYIRDKPKEDMQHVYEAIITALLKKYNDIGCKDYIFSTKRIQRIVGFPLGQCRSAIVQMKREGKIRQYNRRFYITNFLNSPIEIESKGKKSLFQKLICRLKR